VTPAQRRALVEALHDHPARLVLAVTGGGVAIVTDLLLVPGASRTVLEATVPYSTPALAQLVGGAPTQAVSAATAAAMAQACLRRASVLAAADAGPLLGVGCTAALATDRQRRGVNHAHLAIAASERADRAGSDAGIASWHLELDKTLERGRDAEDRLTADAVLAAIAAVCGLEPPLAPALAPSDRLARS